MPELSARERDLLARFEMGEWDLGCNEEEGSQWSALATDPLSLFWPSIWNCVKPLGSGFISAVLAHQIVPGLLFQPLPFELFCVGTTSRLAITFGFCKALKIRGGSVIILVYSPRVAHDPIVILPASNADDVVDLCRIVADLYFRVTTKLFGHERGCVDGNEDRAITGDAALYRFV